MKIKNLLLSLSLLSIIGFSASAQDQPEDDKLEALMSDPVPGKVYSSVGLEGHMLSTAFIHNKFYNTDDMGILRYTLFWNLGWNWNYDFNNTFGLFWGLSLKNLGFIEKNNGITEKHRTYNIGIPVGLKIGNMSNEKYMVIGGGVDFPIHYKRKTWEDREDKVKEGEWFSDQINPIQPFIFIGGKFGKVFFAKLQYYPNNFLSNNYRPNWDGPNPDISNMKEVNILSLTLGFDINMRPKF